MDKRKFFVLLICFVLITALITACGQVQQPKNQNRNNNNDTGGQQTRVVPRTVSPRRVVPSPTPGTNIRNNNRTNDTNMIDNLMNNDNNNGAGDNEDYTKRVEELAEEIADIKEIESATCVITGNTALVGVQFEEQYKGDITNAIKEKVEAVCKREDPEISRVVVTADPDVLSRIQDILQDIGEGRPVSGFVEEVNELINRIQPK